MTINNTPPSAPLSVPDKTNKQTKKNFLKLYYSSGKVIGHSSTTIPTVCLSVPEERLYYSSGKVIGFS